LPGYAKTKRDSIAAAANEEVELLRQEVSEMKSTMQNQAELMSKQEFSTAVQASFTLMD